MGKLPPQVLECSRAIARAPSHDLKEVAVALIDQAGRNPALVSMWRSLQSRAVEMGIDHDAHWVWSFLRCVQWASTHEVFAPKSMKARRAEAKQIRSLSSKLIKLLSENALNVHVVREPKRHDSRWWIYEDLDESKRSRCDDSGEPKLSVIGIMERTAERAAMTLETEYYLGKSSVNWSAIRFCRRLVEANEVIYGTPLNQVVATAANALHPDVNYSEQDVMNLMAR